MHKTYSYSDLNVNQTIFSIKARDLLENDVKVEDFSQFYKHNCRKKVFIREQSITTQDAVHL